MLCLVIFSMESLKSARITITHVYFSALTLAVSLGSSLNSRPNGNFLEPQQMLMHEKTCMIPIFDKFSIKAYAVATKIAEVYL